MRQVGGKGEEKAYDRGLINLCVWTLGHWNGGGCKQAVHISEHVGRQQAYEHPTRRVGIPALDTQKL